MELYPLWQATETSFFCLGLLYDTPMPTDAEKKLQDALNDSAGLRVFKRSMVSGFVPASIEYIPQPMSSVLIGATIAPAWVQFAGTPSTALDDATRIVPKVTLPAVSGLMSDLQKNAWTTTVMGTILAHKISNGNFSFVTRTAFPAGLNFQYNKRTDTGAAVGVEYDFGAPIDLGSVEAVSFVAGKRLLSSTGTILQAKVDDVWTDIIATSAAFNMSSTNYKKYMYTLPTTVRAQKFRLVHTNPDETVVADADIFALNFYGKYVGAAPKTVQKIQHMTVIPAAPLATDSQWNCVSPGVLSNARSRFVSMTHLSLTDDLSKIDSADIFVQSLDPTDAQEFPLPGFRVALTSIIGDIA